MSIPSGATIIPFPAHAGTPVRARGRLHASSRTLSDAMRALSAALAEQNAVARLWREAMLQRAASAQAAGEPGR